MPRRRASAKRTASVGRAVDAFVAVVVGQPVGQHDEQPPRRAAVALQHRGAMADRRAQPRVRAGHEAAKPPHHQRVEVVVETLHRHQRAPRTGPASGRRRAPRGRRDRAARRSARRRPRAAARARSGRARRARRPIRRRRAEAAPRGRAGGAGCRGRPPRRAPTRPSPRPAPRPPRRCRCRRPAPGGGSDPARRRGGPAADATRAHRDSPSAVSPAVGAARSPARCTSRPVAPAMDVPLRDTFRLALARRLRRRPRTRGAEVDVTMPRAANAAPRSVRRRVGARRSAAAELAHHAQHLLQQLADRRRRRRPGWRTRSMTSASLRRRRHRVRRVSSPIAARAWVPPHVVDGSALGVRRQQVACLEWRRRSRADRRSSARSARQPAMRPGSRCGWRCRRSMSERTTGYGSSSSFAASAGGPRPRDSAWPAPGVERACARHRAPGCRLPAAMPDRSATRAAAAALGGVDEHGVAIGPRGFARSHRRHRHSATGQSRRQQPKPLEAVIIGPLVSSPSPLHLAHRSPVDQISVPP